MVGRYDLGGLAMNPANARPARGMYVDVLEVDMDRLSNVEYSDLSRLFQVPRECISLKRHPLNSSDSFLEIEFLSGINLAPAIATYLNSEFYKEQGTSLQYSVNSCAWCDDANGRQILCLSIPRNYRDNFVEALVAHADDIQYVMAHPEILFMIRPEVNYRTARANLQKGYRPAL